LHESGEYPHDMEGCKKNISDALYDMRFVYKNPDNEVSIFVHPEQCDTKAHADCVV